MTRIITKCVMSGFFVLAWNLAVSAQETIDDIKSKIIEVHSVQNRFAASLKHCGELDGNVLAVECRCADFCLA